jgi:hypothetical protein
MTTTTSVYVAGSSEPGERARVAKAIQALRENRVEVASTWLESVAAHGGVGNQRNITPEARRALVWQDLGQVSAAGVFWFLVPPPEVHTRGAWAELAYAHSQGKRIICSGDTGQSIFTAIGLETLSDEVALHMVVTFARGEVLI